MKKTNKLQAGELTWQQERFVEYYVSNGGNASRAYVQAGYRNGSPNVGAAILLKLQKVKDAVAAEREHFQSVLNFKREDQLLILHGMATATVDDFDGVDPSDKESFRHLGYKRHAVQSLEQTKDGVRIKLCNKREALDGLAAILGFEAGSDSGSREDLDLGMGDALARIKSRRKE